MTMTMTFFSMKTPGISFDHVIKLAIASYCFNNLPLQMVFSRALFADCFKGMPRDNFSAIITPVSKTTKLEIQPEPVKREFLHEKESMPMPEAADQKNKKSSKFYSSLTYTLSILNNSNDSESSDADSTTSSLNSNMPRYNLNMLTLENEKEKDSIKYASDVDSKYDASDIEKQMRAFGLPTNFGNVRTKKIRNRQITNNCKSSTTNLDFMTILHMNELLKSNYLSDKAYTTDDIAESQQFASSIHLCSRSSDDNFYNVVNVIFPSLCRTLELGCSLCQSRASLPMITSISLPKSWRNACRQSVDQNIQALLTGGRALRYKPNCARSNRQFVEAASTELAELINESGDVGIMQKYWAQRYRLFSRFDQGIQFDKEGLFSVTPEVIAFHHANRLSSFLDGPTSARTIVDLFAGIGGNSIQLALNGFNVVAIDLSAKMLAMAKVNAKVYGVEEKITFIQSDAFEWLAKPHASSFDAILASPPWGGPAYGNEPSFDLNCLCFDRGIGNQQPSTIWDLVHLMSKTANIGAPLALFLPRNSNIVQLFQLQRIALEASPRQMNVRSVLEVEVSLIHKKAKALTVYLHTPLKTLTSEEGESISSNESEFYDCVVDAL